MKKAAILAAGNSTRMLPLSANTPKHLLPVGGTPLIFHTLHALAHAGIRETLVIYGYRGHLLQSAIDAEDWGGMAVRYIEQRERRGTAHAASHAREFAGSDPVLLLNGDVLFGAGTIDQLVRYHEQGGYSLTVSVYPVDNPSAYGVLDVRDGVAVGLVEKPPPGKAPSNLINAGMYCATDELWDAIDSIELSERNEYEITDAIARLISKGRVGAFTVPSWWIDIGRPWDLLEANRFVLGEASSRIDGVVEDGATLKGTVIVEADATVRAGAYIEGPAYIGHGSTVGPNCYVRPHTSLCGRVKIGNAVEVKNSILMDGTNVGHLSYVGDSIIGQHVNFGAGTITANLRHDNRNIRVTVKGERVDSGRRKLGAIVGDNVKTGIGTCIAPGVVIHQGARTGMGVIVDCDIPPYTLVLARQPQTTVELELSG